MLAMKRPDTGTTIPGAEFPRRLDRSEAHQEYIDDLERQLESYDLEDFEKQLYNNIYRIRFNWFLFGAIVGSLITYLITTL